MRICCVLAALCLIRNGCAYLGDDASCRSLTYVTRDGWGSLNKTTTPATGNLYYFSRTPVKYFFVHHTAQKRCFNREDCSALVRNAQVLHIQKKWGDIGYNFLVDEEGAVYEGRSWKYNGAHTMGFNCNAFAAAVIGDFTSRSPNAKAVEAIRTLIQCGIEQGKLRDDYVVQGHKDSRVTITECPGKTFYSEIVMKFPKYPDRKDPCWDISIIERCSWGFYECKHCENRRTQIVQPVPYVIVHISDGNCKSCKHFETCMLVVQEIHQRDGKANSDKDIGYHFLIGGDGNVYDGRGTNDAQNFAWEYVGNHGGEKWNNISYGITFIGNFDSEPPNQKAMIAFANLLECGVRRGYLREDYVIYVHSDLMNRPSKCHGKALKEEIMKLAHYQPYSEVFIIPDAVGDESHCTFQTDTCDWYQDPQTNVKLHWKRHKGAADEAGLTGPLTDADNNVNGYYLLADASEKNGTPSKITSAKWTLLKQFYCLKFWYHMYGQDVEELSLRVTLTNIESLFGESHSETFCRICKNQGDKWHQTAVNITIKTKWAFKAFFEFVAKSKLGGYRGDIALDNIELTEGHCSGHQPSKCNC